MEFLEELLAGCRRWWQSYTGEEETPLDGDTPAWFVSLFIHVAVLLSLALVALRESPRSAPAITIIQPQEAVEDVLEVPREIAVADEEESHQGAVSDESSMEVAQALAPTLSEQSVVPIEEEIDLASDVTLEPIDVIPAAATLDATVVVKGAVGAGATGATGAIDRLTGEIAASLDQRPTVVCWVFDQSVSLAAQRKEIAARLERVFDELGVNRLAARRPDLKNMVIAYGKNVMLVTKATDDAAAVVKAIETIPIDDSGVEMTFTAIRNAANEASVFRRAPRRNVMIIAFTDEVGNDQNEADKTAAFCRTLGIPVYVVGVPAPFGMKEVKFKFVEFDKQYDQEVQWAVVEQGPETLYPEVVRVRSGKFADEAIDSGFGPFSLSKLCAATGGIYFAVHANRGAQGRVSDDQTAAMSSRLRHFFDSDVMRNYQPDYLSAATIDKMLAGNKAKRVLVDAARSVEVAPMESPTMEFPRQDDGQLAQLLGEAQKTAARIQPRIDVLAELLKSGLQDRDAIKEKRWQAGYDLALGRVLALKVRTDAYNSMLAQAKSGMRFKDPNNDTWVLEESEDVSKAGSQTEKTSQQAVALLERVVRDHPGTPWALLAAEELRRPLGYTWSERHTGVNKPKMGAGGGGVPSAGVDDKKRMLADPKPKRQLKNL
ncbi:MAG: vWA domain-containing protein [Planctomycetia bacterium]